MLFTVYRKQIEAIIDAPSTNSRTFVLLKSKSKSRKRSREKCAEENSRIRLGDRFGATLRFGTSRVAERLRPGPEPDTRKAPCKAKAAALVATPSFTFDALSAPENDWILGAGDVWRDPEILKLKMRRDSDALRLSNLMTLGFIHESGGTASCLSSVNPTAYYDLGSTNDARLQAHELHLFCEGAQTEPNYLRDFLRVYGISTKNIRLHDDVPGSPGRLLKRALVEAERNRACGEAWIVCDRDGHEDFDAMLTTVASTPGVHAAPSFICIETWFLLHFPEVLLKRTDLWITGNIRQSKTGVRITAEPSGSWRIELIGRCRTHFRLLKAEDWLKELKTASSYQKSRTALAEHFAHRLPVALLVAAEMAKTERPALFGNVIWSGLPALLIHLISHRFPNTAKTAGRDRLRQIALEFLLPEKVRRGQKAGLEAWVREVARNIDAWDAVRKDFVEKLSEPFDEPSSETPIDRKECSIEIKKEVNKLNPSDFTSEDPVDLSKLKLNCIHSLLKDVTNFSTDKMDPAVLSMLECLVERIASTVGILEAKSDAMTQKAEKAFHFYKAFAGEDAEIDCRILRDPRRYSSTVGVKAKHTDFLEEELRTAARRCFANVTKNQVVLYESFAGSYTGGISGEAAAQSRLRPDFCLLAAERLPERTRSDQTTVFESIAPDGTTVLKNIGSALVIVPESLQRLQRMIAAAGKKLLKDSHFLIANRIADDLVLPAAESAIVDGREPLDIPAELVVSIRKKRPDEVWCVMRMPSEVTAPKALERFIRFVEALEQFAESIDPAYRIRVIPFYVKNKFDNDMICRVPSPEFTQVYIREIHEFLLSRILDSKGYRAFVKNEFERIRVEYLERSDRNVSASASEMNLKVNKFKIFEEFGESFVYIRSEISRSALENRLASFRSPGIGQYTNAIAMLGDRRPGGVSAAQAAPQSPLENEPHYTISPLFGSLWSVKA